MKKIKHCNKKSATEENSLNAIDVAMGARLITLGAVVAYPTEACFGIGCDPTNRSALKRIARIKNRPVGKGLIVIAHNVESLLPYLSIQNESILDQPLATWPGPYTWIFPVSSWASNLLCSADKTIAVRVTAHSVAAHLSRLAGGAIISTSANRHGLTPIRQYVHVERCLGKQLDFVVRGTLGHQKKPTQIRDAMTGHLVRAA